MKTQERSRSYDRADAQVAEDVTAWLRGRLPDFPPFRLFFECYTERRRRSERRPP